MQTSQKAHAKATNQAPTFDELLGEGPEETALEKLAKIAKKVKMGDMVFYHGRNPLEDGILSYAAIVTKKNENGSVSLTVFGEGNELYFSKIPIASEVQAGYYTVRSVEGLSPR